MQRTTLGKSTVLTLLIIVAGAQLGSSGEGCCTDDCEQALRHMGNNIQGQSCDATRMDTARERIEDDCYGGFDVDLAVGNLVEQCRSTSGDTPRVRCTCPGCNTRIAVDFVNETTAADGIGPIDFSIRDSAGDFLYFRTALIAPGETERSSFVANNYNALSFRVRDELAEYDGDVGDQRVPFVTEALCIRTPSEWSPYQYRRVVFSVAADGTPTVTTENFNCDF